MPYWLTAVMEKPLVVYLMAIDSRPQRARGRHLTSFIAIALLPAALMGPRFLKSLLDSVRGMPSRCPTPAARARHGIQMLTLSERPTSWKPALRSHYTHIPSSEHSLPHGSIVG